MDVRTYRAASIQQALRLVWRDLGPDAAVLHTREVSRGLLGWIGGGRQIEVTASCDIAVPSRLPPREPDDEHEGSRDAREATEPVARERGVEMGGWDSLWPAAEHADDPVGGGPRDPDPFHKSSSDTSWSSSDTNWPSSDASWPSSEASHFAAAESPGLPSDQRGLELDRLVAGQMQAGASGPAGPAFQLFTELIDADLSEDLARELVEELSARYGGQEPDDLPALRAEIQGLVEQRIAVGGPLRVNPGRRRVVALVGPTGVGKTTTIAKLAANFHLRQRHRVALITVDTYRIAAVEQLRTYADIIDLPMEVVSTPKEMRRAVDRFTDRDLVLLDTAGRSPRDEVRIQELKSMLAEARADEVHLVLSAVGGLPAMRKTVERFARVGTTSLLLTKLDEATGLGDLLPLLQSCGLPLSYVTNGQNVPDDIAAADAGRLARCILDTQRQTLP